MTKLVLGMDPGPTETAFVIWDPQEKKVREHGKVKNDELIISLAWLIDVYVIRGDVEVTAIIEMIQSQGMPVGKTVFETCVWIGKYMSVIKKCLNGKNLYRAYRSVPKLWHTGDSRAKDGNIRAALINKYGQNLTIPPKKPPKEPKPITIRSRFQLSNDEWQALAIATFCSEASEEKVIFSVDEFGIIEKFGGVADDK